MAASSSVEVGYGRAGTVDFDDVAFVEALSESDYDDDEEGG
jgi:hypothetical protein